jgi:hypothetical protein
LIDHVLPQPEEAHIGPGTARVRDRARTGADPDPRPRWFLYVTDRVARRAGHRARGEDPEGPTNPLIWPRESDWRARNEDDLHYWTSS